MARTEPSSTKIRDLCYSNTTQETTGDDMNEIMRLIIPMNREPLEVPLNVCLKQQLTCFENSETEFVMSNVKKFPWKKLAQVERLFKLFNRADSIVMCTSLSTTFTPSQQNAIQDYDFVLVHKYEATVDDFTNHKFFLLARDDVNQSLVSSFKNDVKEKLELNVQLIENEHLKMYCIRKASQWENQKQFLSIKEQAVLYAGSIFIVFGLLICVIWSNRSSNQVNPHTVNE